MHRLMTKEDRAQAKSFYIRGKTRITVKGLDLEFYLDDKSTCSAMMFKGTAGRPSAHYRFKTPERRADWIRRQIEGERASAALKAQYKAKREAASRLEIGHILVTCWGYDQTNREFYKVIATKGQRTIIVQELEQIITSTGDMQGTCTPGEGFAKGSKPITCMVQHGDSAKIEGHYARLWEGRPMNWTSYA